MHRRGRVLLTVAVAIATIAGCIDDVGPPVSSRTVPSDAPSEGGSGSYALAVRVVDEPGGPAIPGAAVVVYWGDFSGSGGTFDVEGSTGPGGSSGSVDGVVRLSSNPDTPEPDTTVPLRTDDAGVAVARVPANRVVGVVVSAAGHTEEWAPAVATGEGGGNVTFPVYRSRVVYQRDAAWGPAGASPGRVSGGNYMWEPAEVEWGDTPEARAGYVHRLASLRMNLNWSNGPTGGGDLAIGASTTSSDPDYVQESDDAQVGPGTQTEEAFVDLGLIDEMGWPASDTLYVGPATATAFAAPFGLDYVLEVEATFDPFVARAFDGADTPTPGVLVSLVLLGLSAVGARRLRGR